MNTTTKAQRHNKRKEHIWERFDKQMAEERSKGESAHTVKLGPAERYEVNSLMESAQYDLEGVLFQLVWQREHATAQRDELLEACKALLVAGEKLVSHDDYVKQFGFSQEHAVDNALTAIQHTQEAQ